MIRKKNKEQRSIRFPIDLYEKIEDLSIKEDCSFTEVVISILQDYFELPNILNPSNIVAEPRVQYNTNPLQEQITELTKIITDLERRMTLLDAINKKEPDTKNK